MGLLHDLIVRIKGDSTQLDSTLQKTQSSFGSWAKKVAGFMAAAFSVGIIINFGKRVLGLYDVQAKAERSLLVALKGREDIQQSIIRQAGELQKVTLFGDEKTIEAGSRLAMIIGDNEDALKRLLPLVQDFATGKKMDLAASADLVAKSIGSSTNALTRYGIEINGAVGSSERLESAIYGLNKQVGGQAVAAAEVGAGAVTKWKNAWGDFQEVLGEKLMPTMTRIAEFATNVLGNALDDTHEDLQNIYKDISDIDWSVALGTVIRDAKIASGEIDIMAESWRYAGKILTDKFYPAVKKVTGAAAKPYEWMTLPAPGMPKVAGTYTPTFRESLQSILGTKKGLTTGPEALMSVEDLTKALYAQQEAVSLLSASFSALFTSTGQGFQDMIDVFITGIKRLVAELLAKSTVLFLMRAIFPMTLGVGATTQLMKMFGGIGFQHGGTVPPGYPNDTYPALLSSGEKIIPAGGTQNIHLEVDEVKVKGRDIVIALRRSGIQN